MKNEAYSKTVVNLQGGPKKTGATIFDFPYLQNVRTNSRDFWHTSTLCCSECMCRLYTEQIYNASDKINNPVFRLQKPARPLYSNAHIFKPTGLFCTLSGSLQRRDVLNMFVSFIFINYVIQSGATRWNTNYF